MSSSDWKPLVPPVPLADAAPEQYERAFKETIADIKALISDCYESVNFGEDTHKAGYQVINCKNINAVLSASDLLANIERCFNGLKCKISLNMLPKSGPVVEILVPRRMRYGFSETYSLPQRVLFGVAAACIVAAVAFMVRVGMAL